MPHTATQTPTPAPARLDPSFSHKPTFTGYMARVVDHFAAGPSGLHILDVPAGSGVLTDALRAQGHRVVSADINDAREDFVYADMNGRLPFEDQTFDAVICLEGIEHVLSAYRLLRELIRVTKVNGLIVVSTPNVMSMYSRLQFLFTGTFHQFEPSQLAEVAPGEMKDRFHISPVSLSRMRYVAHYFGAEVVKLDADKMKRKILMPLYWLIRLIGWPWRRSLFFGKAYDAWRPRNEKLYRDINSKPALYGRSIIVFFQRVKAELPE
jgi:SAM-dependent methyltransferase